MLACRGPWRAGLGLLLALGVVACRATPGASSRPRLLVVGVDGADPGVIRRLAAAGDLPNLSKLIERGSFVSLKSDFDSASPVVWTTMVTGVGPDQHGIRDFFVADGKGSYPVMSGARLRPALWNMLDRVGRRGAFLGIWATWPAEKTSGLILSDRAMYEELDGSIYPPERAKALTDWRALAKAPGNPFPRAGAPVQDQLANLAAREAVADPTFDLVFVYFESIDVVSHHYWHLFERRPFRHVHGVKLPLAETENPVREAYRSIDAVIGDLLAHSPKEINTIVVSDHGFKAQPRASNQITLGFDLVLSALGFLQWTPDGSVDVARSEAWTFDSPSYTLVKQIQTRPGLAAREREAIVGRLRRELMTCRFAESGPAFEPREPKLGHASDVALEVKVLTRNAASRLVCGGKPIPEAVRYFGGPATGGHDSDTAGTLIVHGPLFARGASQPGVSVRDIAPTILYALGLPVGKDFIGKPALDLFAPEFRRAHPVRQIDSWGKRERQALFASSADEKLIQKLVALGYLQ